MPYESTYIPQHKDPKGIIESLFSGCNRLVEDMQKFGEQMKNEIANE